MPDHSYPPGDWTVEELERTLATADEAFPLPTYDEADVWKPFRSDPLTGPVAETILSEAERAREEPLPSLPASGYLHYTRASEGGTYRNKDRDMRRRKRLSLFVLAERLEREGRYLDAVLDYAWAMCEQSAWLLPPHLSDAQNHDGLPRPAPPEERGLALFSARVAQLLAEMDHVLGGQLHPALRDRIRDEVERRVFQPYEARDDLHWDGVPGSNWNAVCTADTAIAAMHLVPAVDRLARILGHAVESLGHYLDGFDEDGCTAEGIGYWNFGVSHYAMLAAHLEARTDGRYSLLPPPIVEEIARFPLRVELSPGRYVAFSDADEAAWIEPFVTCWLGERLDRPELIAFGRNGFADRQSLFPVEKVGTLSEMLRNLAWCDRTSTVNETVTPPRRTSFGGPDWWVVRADPDDPDGLVVAAKGGHNAEPHNHNDCGSFVVHWRGESLVTDLGRNAYDGDYFGERRYEYLATRSLGHSVPHVNGYEQAAGAEHAASVVDRTESASRDAIALELAACYPDEAGLESLRRRIALERDAPPRVTIRDEAAFRVDAPGRTFEFVLVSYFPIERAETGLAVTGTSGRLDVAFDPGAAVAVEHLPDAVEIAGPTDGTEDHRDVWRARISPEPEAEPSTPALEMQCTVGRSAGESG
jgi:hypothetical protein